MDDWFDELDKFVSEAEPENVASKLGISKEAAEALLSFAEETNRSKYLSKFNY